MKKLFAGLVFGIWSLGIVSCAIGDLIDLPNINMSGCIKDCNATNKTCLNQVTVECPESDQCFDSLNSCFDSATECSKNCNGCDAEGTCSIGESACVDLCIDLGQSCADMIETCLDLEKECFNQVADGKEVCVNELVECIAVCIEDAEGELTKI